MIQYIYIQTETGISVANCASFMGGKSPTNCDAHLAERIYNHPGNGWEIQRSRIIMLRITEETKRQNSTVIMEND